MVSLLKGNLSQMHLFQFGEYLANSGRSFPVHQIPVEKFYRPEKKRLKLENHNFEKGKLSFIHLYHFAFSRLSFGWGGGGTNQCASHSDLRTNAGYPDEKGLSVPAQPWQRQIRLSSAFFLPCGSQ